MNSVPAQGPDSARIDDSGKPERPSIAEGRRKMRPQDYDRHVASRVRNRRITVGLSQQDLAHRIGVTYQQLHKYETGLNRISAARLYAIAQALEVEVGHFFEGLTTGTPPARTNNPRQLLEFTKGASAVRNRRHLEALGELTRSLAEHAPEDAA